MFVVVDAYFVIEIGGYLLDLVLFGVGSNVLDVLNELLVHLMCVLYGSRFGLEPFRKKSFFVLLFSNGLFLFLLDNVQVEG